MQIHKLITAFHIGTNKTKTKITIPTIKMLTSTNQGFTLCHYHSNTSSIYQADVIL